MFKFFRRIRQQLIVENRISKYLLYAIGEIVLVVIGILIALAINGRANAQKNRAEEKVHLENLLAELEKIENRSLYENSLLKDKVIFNCRRTLAQIHGEMEMMPLDSMPELFYGIISIPNSEFVFNTYENIINTNALNLITNNEIRNALSEVSNGISFRNTALDWQNDQWSTINQPYIIQNIEFLDVTAKKMRADLKLPASAYHNDWNAIFKQKEFRNFVYNRFLAALDVLDPTNLLLEKIIHCKELIAKELKDNHSSSQ